jgi:choline monooxygenase
VRFSFDRDPARASTIPARLYTDPTFAELERDRVFARTWQLVARADQLADVGSYVTTEVAGEPLVLVRDRGGLRAFYNVCLHRAGPVAYGCGKRHTMQCKYHGWTYGLDGALLHAPEMDGAVGFDARDFHLTPVGIDTLGVLVFVNLDPHAAPLHDTLEGLGSQVAGCALDRMQFVLSKEWTVGCNWKVYIDNYLEGYHVPVVHPELHREIDYDAYRVEVHRWFSRQHAPVRAASPHQPDRTLTAETGAEAHYYWVYPNWMLNAYQGQLQTNVVVPLDHARTLVRFDWYTVDPPRDEATRRDWDRVVRFASRIQDEDVSICEVVQRNLRSRAYDRGRYSPRRENGVHHFHSLLHDALT